MNKSLRYQELRKGQYEYHKARFSYLFCWNKNPYTFLKARLYMELSAIFVLFLLKTNITPNTITVIYGLCGVLGGILLAIPNYATIITASIIFFFKGVLDWSDGHFARITGQTSLTGYVLDAYGAFLNKLGFQAGLGFYVACKDGAMLFYYLIALLLFFHAASPTNFSYKLLFEYASKKREQQLAGIDVVHGEKYKFITSIFDDRARSVDFVLMLIVVELIFPNIFITWIVFLGVLIKEFVIFSGKFYFVWQKKWVENTLVLANPEMTDINNGDQI